MSDALTPADLAAEGATALPSKEVMSLLDLNANIDLGLDLAAPVDLAAAANLNVAAPIEAAAGANVLSSGADATALAHQQGVLDQGMSGTTAHADAPQHASLDQGAISGTQQTTTDPAPASGSGTTVGSPDSLLNGGSLLDANIDVHANAAVAAPIDGAVAANGNVAAPIDAAVSANVLSPDAHATALAPQEVLVSQHLDDVTADAMAAQDASVSQQ